MFLKPFYGEVRVALAGVRLGGLDQLLEKRNSACMWKLTKNGERIFSFTSFQIHLKFEFFFLVRTGLSALEILSIPSSTGTVEGFTLGPFLVALLFGFLGGATSLEGGMGEFSREREFSLERLFSFCLFEDRPLLEGLGVSWSISLSALDTCKIINQVAIKLWTWIVNKILRNM